MKNKNLIIGVVVFILLIIGGGFFVLSSGNKTPMQQGVQTPVEDKIATMSPEEIGLDLTPTHNNQHLIITIDKPQGIKTIKYELTWGVKVEDKSSGDLLDGRQGTTSGEDPIELNERPYKHEIKLGTCSDVCHYDKGVNNIKIIVKVTKTDGTVAQVEKSLEN